MTRPLRRLVMRERRPVALAVLGHVRRRARAQGVADGRSGAVAIIQRFGAALMLNIHTHALVLDGVFAEEGSGGLRFHPAAPPTDAEMDAVLGLIARRMGRLLGRPGPSRAGTNEGSMKASRF